MLRQFRAVLSKLPRSELPWTYQQVAALAGRSAANDQQSYAEPQPLSQAVVQLEAVVTDAALPKDVLVANEASLQTLKAFLASLSNQRAYPKAGIKNVAFSVKRGPRLQRIRCQLKTTGGDCSRLVANSLGDMLARMGLNPDIYFDRDEFQPNPEKEPTEQDMASARAKAAAAGFPSQAITEEEFKQLEEKQQAQHEAKADAADEADEWQDKLRLLDPLFAAVAGVPWMPEREEDGTERRRMIQTRVLDELEAQGWDIRGAAHRVWRGERELARLAAGKDAGSQAAIQSLLFHAKQFDDKFGRKALADVSP